MDYWTLGALVDADQVLSCCCLACGHKNHLDPQVLLDGPKYTPFVYVFDIRSRIKCRQCGQKDIHILLQDRVSLGCWNPDPAQWDQVDVEHLNPDYCA
ncbi:hypothetical protein O4H49_20310 [Kiloniella laminariae]|uniref:Transposase IS204/IS1001/IS1096/IS1165 zinc-finger domain-containing protein n=1 Tax=Kiloniella laminariae TaxID=454162 RepID=A0ABT4LPY2_9PROT|nr:hypothetical protein [Kiloniella laminariae]MCZ4283139.1 hypothetical protein [Kiloniella laminariae]